MEIVLPNDVATIKTDNGSCFIVFIFPNEQLAHNFFLAFVKDWEIGLKVAEEENGKFTFIFMSSNTPGTIIVSTNRTKENNENLDMITNPEFKDYTYLSCGYRSVENHDHVMYNHEGVPAFKK